MPLKTKKLNQIYNYINDLEFNRNEKAANSFSYL